MGLPKSDDRWQDDAACAGLPTDLFYIPDGVRMKAKKQRIAAAKRVCATCPVRQQCLEWAVAIGEGFGVWGGATPKERIALGMRPVQSPVGKTMLYNSRRGLR